jgi:hypothetical protein
MYRLPPAAGGPEFRALLDYWIARFPKDSPGQLPGRQHIDPTDLPARYLAQLLLLDVIAATPRRFRFRVAGTAFAAIIGRDVTGLHFDELGGAPDRVAPVAKALDLIVEQGRPVFVEGALTLPSDDFFWVKRLGLPLARDGRNVDMVLGLWLAQRKSRTDLAREAAVHPDGPGPQLLERI